MIVQASPIPEGPDGTPPRIRVPGQAPIEAFGGGAPAARAYQAAGGLANTGERILQDKLDRIMQGQVNDGLAALDDEITRQAVALRGLKGKEAYQASRTALSSLDKVYEGLEKNTQNPAVKEALRQKFTQRRDTFFQHAYQYGNDQLLAASDASALTRIEKARNAAVALGTPEAVQQSIAEANEQYALLARNGRMSQDVLEWEQAKNASATHAGVIRRMLDTGNDLSAKEYYEANKAALIGKDADAMASMVSRQSLLGEAQRISDMTFIPRFEGYKVSEGVDAVREVPAPETLKDAIDLGRKQTEGKSPELRSAVDNQITYEWNLRQRSAQEANKKDMVDAANLIDGGTQYEKLPADLIERLKPTDRKALKSYAEKDPVTDDATWYALKLMGSSEVTRDKFLRLNLLAPQYINSLSKADRRKFMEWQGDLIEKKESAMDEGRGFLTTNAIVSGADDKIPKKGRSAFARIVNEQVTLWQNRNPGKKIGSAEVIEIVDSLLQPVKKERSFWWDGEQMMYETMKPNPDSEQEQKKRDVLLGMPEADREKLQSDFKARGIPLTERSVFDAYEALLESRKRNAGR